MASRLERYFSQPAGFFKLWAGVLIAPVAWAMHLQISYMMVPWACAARWQFVLHLVTVGALSLALVGGFIAWRNLKRTSSERKFSRDDEQISEDNGSSSSRFLAYTGLLSSTFFFLVIVAQGIPNFILNPCL